MQKIHLLFRDNTFLKKILRIFPQHAKLSEQTEWSMEVQVKSALAAEDTDLIIMDWQYISHLRDLNPVAKVMITSETYDKNKEYLSARLGAKGFITKDMNTLLIKRAVDTVNAGQIWMTRAVAARVVDEYRRVFRGNKHIPEA